MQDQPTQDEIRQRIVHGRYVRPDNSVRRPIQQTIVELVSAPQPNPVVAAPPSSPEPQPHAPTTPVRQRTLFSAILDATVQVERVTRQSVMTVRHSFEPPHISAMRSHRQKLLVRSFYAVGSLSFVLALSLGIYAITRTGNSEPVVSKSVLGANSFNVNDTTRNSEIPSENLPSRQDIETYLVAPQYPRYLKIPSIGVDTRIRRLGIDSKGAISTPNNINDAGWYDASVKPGEKEGASVIEGHVAGPTQHGVFWQLNKLKYGDTVSIEKGSGEILKYRVTKTERVPTNQLEMSKYLSAEVTNRHDLKLITAAGQFNIVTGVYDTRLVVYAEQVI